MEKEDCYNTAVAKTLIQRDKACIWHPYTRIQNARDPIPIIKGKGVYLYAEDGTKYIDGISSWWVNLHGHVHPYIVEKISEQAAAIEHVIFADFTHPTAIQLAEKLIQFLPGVMGKVFYSDNGSTAVEVALKIALQYWFNSNSKTKRKKVICFNRGYHGDTFGAMSVGERGLFNRPFWNHLFEVEFIDPPFSCNEEKSLEQLRAILEREESACFIFEPLILGVGGMHIYQSRALDALLNLCRDYHVLTIADEVMTGFGRTGPLFACEYLTEQPDMICLSKGLTGGFMPLGVTACKNFIFESFRSDELSKSFLHGHSYTGNPLACSAALASFELLEKSECDLQRKRIAEQHQGFCKKWRNHPKLNRCESIGTILVLEYVANEQTNYQNSLRDKLYGYFLERKILLRPLGNIVYVMPPYCISPEELTYIYEVIIDTL
ncbi:MAG: adenosylmethionine--8-amino-7-oxononanoate transaminase [Parachlamydiaceae bacterium]|nr:adenosylmethionine--8-amino-7-oxononanoate transaminase [Parachlamydiaceae bacterium]